jgi:hypothetical protein
VCLLSPEGVPAVYWHSPRLPYLGVESGATGSLLSARVCALRTDPRAASIRYRHFSPNVPFRTGSTVGRNEHQSSSSEGDVDGSEA